MNKIVPIKPMDLAVEVLPSFTDTLSSLGYLACSGLLKKAKVMKLRTDLLSNEEIEDLFRDLAGKSVYVAFFDDPLFKTLDKGIDLIEAPQDVNWK